jgi:hypothetical protein
MVEEAKSRGYSIVSTAIAQACIESAWGLSGLAKYNNFFGLKCGKNWKGAFVTMNTKEEYVQGQLVTIRDNFRAFNNMSDGVKGYYDFISSVRYTNLKLADTSKQYAEYLKQDGYATSSTYVNTLITTVERWSLTQYDKILSGAPVNGNPYPEPVITLRYNSRGNGVRWCQYFLNKHGARLIVDGVFKDATLKAVKELQQKAFPDNPEEWDGIVGPKTRTALLQLS